MENMFRILGKKVELIRYRVTYIEDGIEIIENCVSDEHKTEIENNLMIRDIEFTTVVVNQTENEWINGLEFDSYDKALIAFNNPSGYKEPSEIDMLKEDIIDTMNALTEVYEMLI